MRIQQIIRYKPALTVQRRGQTEKRRMTVQWDKSGWWHPLSTMSVQKGIEEDEPEGRELQVEEIQHMKIQKQEGVGAFTEVTHKEV